MSNFKNIGVIGDSIYKGTTYDDSTGKYTFNSDAYISEIEKRFGIKIFNVSRLGMTTDRIISRGTHISLLKDHPEIDTVLLSIGGNDSDFDWVDVGNHPELPHSPHNPPEKFRENAVKIISELISYGVKVIVLGLVPINSQRFFEHLSKKADGEGVLKWLGSIQRTYMWQEYYNDILFEAASELEAPYINLRRVFISYPHFENLVCSDGMHLTKDGYDLLVTSLVTELSGMKKNIGTDIL